VEVEKEVEVPKRNWQEQEGDNGTKEKEEEVD
jgi:hypothetical protein